MKLPHNPLNEIQRDVIALSQIVIDASRFAPDEIAPTLERRAKKFVLKYRVKKRLQPKFQTL